MDRKPEFFIVGAPKAGTTSLYHYLIQHPEIFMPVRKEPYFFGNWREDGKKDLQEYLNLFGGVPESKVAGEASTAYLYLRSAAEEIKEFQSGAKIIIVLRNPVERAYSQYWHHVRNGLDNTFEEELESEEKRIREGWRGFRPGLVPPAYYIESGRYSKHVEHYMKTFGRERVRVYLFEDLVGDPQAVCRDTFEFLGVDPVHQISTGQVYNSSGPLRSPTFYRLLFSVPTWIREPVKQALPLGVLKKVREGKELMLQKNIKAVPDMKLKTRAYLQQVFKDDVLYVEELTGRDLSHWLGNDRVLCCGRNGLQS